MGKEFQREQGFVQWTKDYPNKEITYNDIISKIGYVVKVDGVIAGYMCIDFENEPAYDDIKENGEQRRPMLLFTGWPLIRLLEVWD